MLPQHGGVPNFRLRIPVPALLLLALVLVSGLLLALSLHFYADEGDSSAHNRIVLTLLVTVLLSVFILVAGTARLWPRHLWDRRGSRRKHRHHSSSRRHRRSRSH